MTSDLVVSEARKDKTKIPREIKQAIRKTVPRRYARAAGIEPYFIPLFGWIYWQRLSTVLRLAQGEASKNDGYVADLGCGFGVLVALLGRIFDAHLVGIDRYPTDILKIAEEISHALATGKSPSFVRGDLSHLAFQSDVFQLCFCLDVLEHVPNVEDCLEEIRRVMKTSGSLFIMVPVEGRVLNIAREVASLHGRRRHLSPHWHGTIANYKEFETRLSDYFSIIKKEYIPNKLFAYDVLYCCKKR
jgi:ubiquinone/menaquinone biosynthesis C-methylase UbiE